MPLGSPMNDLRMRVRDPAERDKYVRDMSAVGYSIATETRLESGEIELGFAHKVEDEVVQAEVLRPLGLPAQEGPSVGRFKPMICTPCYGGLLTQHYLHGYADLVTSLQRGKVEYVPLVFGGESLITRARNRAVMEFLKTDCTHLLFIDADIGFGAEDVRKLVMMNEEVVCGAYPLKHVDWSGVYNAARKGEPAERLATYGTCYAANFFPNATHGGRLDVLKRNGFSYVDVQDAATGFLLIARPAIERIVERFRSSIEYESDYWPNQGEIHFNIFDARIDPTSPREKAKAELLRLAEQVQVSQAPDTGALVRTCWELQRALTESPGRYLSEDYTFSRYHQMCGGKIWLCLDINLTHVGQAEYRGNIGKGIINVLPNRPKKAAE